VAMAAAAMDDESRKISGILFFEIYFVNNGGCDK
jgi:hypothetical protein